MFQPSTKQISDILGSPIENVEKYYPLLRTALDGYASTKNDASIVGSLATVGTESGTFAPVHEAYYVNEKARNQYYFKMYDIQSPDPKRRNVAKQLGNIYPGDGIKFHGRGLIQTTGRANYAILVPVLGVDVVENPDLIMLPQHCGPAFAHYWNKHGCGAWSQKAQYTKETRCQFCKADGLLAIGKKPNGKNKYRRPKFAETVCKDCSWKMVRRLVNGGLTDYDKFKRFVDKVLPLVA